MLVCDLCGGALQVDASGNGAVCTECGLNYSMERLRAKLSADAPAQQTVPQSQTQQWGANTIENPGQQYCRQAPTQRVLHIRRKPTLLLFKANIYIDGQYVGTISTREAGFDVPLSQGEHEIAIIISENVGAQFEPTRFEVGDTDYQGLFYLERRAFSATVHFDITTC